jgi:hypothetical protein
MKLCIQLALLIALLILPQTASAELDNLADGGPGGFAYWHETHWDTNGIHLDTRGGRGDSRDTEDSEDSEDTYDRESYEPSSVPEASPTLVLTLAAAALLQKRRRK